METRQVIRLIFVVSILEFAVGDNYCGNEGVFGKDWQNKCDDDEPWCCGFNEERCCTWEEYSDEHNLDEAAEWIVKIIVGIVVSCVVLVLLLILCCCCLPCCFCAKRRKRQAGVIRGHNMEEVAYPSQPQQNNQAPLVTPHPPQQAYPPQGSAAYPPQGGAAYPPQGGVAYPPQGGAAYPPHGGAAYTPQGGVAYPPQGGAAYPPQPGYYPQDQPPPYSGPAEGYSGPPAQPYQTKQPAYNPNALS